MLQKRRSKYTLMSLSERQIRVKLYSFYPVSLLHLSITSYPFLLLRVTQLTTDLLPLLSVLFVSPTEIVAAVNPTCSLFVCVLSI